MIVVALRLLERAALQTLPSVERESIVGDLNEENRERCRVSAILQIAFCFQIEPYRNIDRALSAFIVAFVGLGLLAVIPVASANMFTDPEVASNPLIRGATLVWGASHITSAIAAGLFVGRTTIIRCTYPIRWQVGGLLSVGIGFSAAHTTSPLVTISVFLTMLAAGSVAHGEIRSSSKERLHTERDRRLFPGS